VGLIGIITEVKLQLTPPSNIKAVSKNLLQDDNIGQDVLGYLQVRGLNDVVSRAGSTLPEERTWGFLFLCSHCSTQHLDQGNMVTIIRCTD
jgi:hypothetical protein